MDGRRLLKSNDFLWDENSRLREENQSLRQQLAQRQDHSRELSQLQQKHQKLLDHNAALRRQIAQLRQQLKTRAKAAPPPFIKPAVPDRNIAGRPAENPATPPACVQRPTRSTCISRFRCRLT